MMIYDTDLTDAQWSLLSGFFERHHGGGRPFKHAPRNILNGCFYSLKTGCQWRLLPKDFPPWKTVHGHFTRWKKDGTWEIILRELHAVLRLMEGREKQASAAIIDSQSIKARTQKRGLMRVKK
jgi:putative transposase